MAAKRRVRQLTVLLAVAMLLATAPAPAGGAGGLTGGGGLAAGAADARRVRDVAVTLPTGDKAILRQEPGNRRSVRVHAAKRAGRAPTFEIVTVRGDTHVFPSDVRHLVGRLLDPELFNLSALVRMGYADATATSLPMIAQHAGTSRRPAGLTAASLRPVRELASVRATAVRQPRTTAARFGAALARTAVSARRTIGPLAGVNRVWLDRRFHTTALDPNLTQIRVPAAWAQGLTGEGVRVAVLDTGIDATHPDLAGQVVAAANFSESDTTTDRHGHGTHVASTVAGTGARAAGQRRGVAFGADLLNGKVLDDFGFGSESGVIAGMEWAAGQRARVVNMSLGGWPTDGTDPVSQAVERLTASHRTLFVVAAGNSGPDEQTVDTPGAATSALTVGAVDVQDRLADFSSRGPRFGDFAMKPDITAPGVDIVAARATGTSLGEPVDEWYTRLSGTSMATPHVAGAAAIMAQRWPDWTPARIKAVLMGTAEPNPELSVYEQGGGRLDVAHAVEQRLIAGRANLDFGYFRYPQTGVQPVTQSLPLLNLGTEPVAVELRVELEGEGGAPAPAAMARVTPAQLTLPAGGQASAQVTVDVRAGPAGLYSGAVVATPSTGPALRTPLGFYKEPVRYDLTLNAIGRDGRPAAFADAGVMNVDDGDLFASFLFLEGGTTTVRVPPGRYHVLGYVVGGNFETVAMVGDPEIRVDGDTTFALDARKALPLATGVEGVATDPSFVDLGYTRIDATGRWGLGASFGVGPDLAEGGLFAQPTDRARRGQFEVEVRARLLPAGATPATAPFLYDLLFYGAKVPDPPDYVLSAAQAARLARVTARYGNLNDSAEYSEGRIGFAPLQFFAGTGFDPLAVPQARVEYLSPAPIQWFHLASWYNQGAFIDFPGPLAKYRPRQRAQERWFGAPLRAEGYAFRVASSMFLGVADFEDTGRHPGYWFEFNDPPVASQALRLYRNGRPLASSQEPFLEVEVPEAEATYRLQRDLDVDGLMGLANVSRTRWWFTSSAPADPNQFEPEPVLSVDYRATPLDGRNGALPGRPVTVDLQVARLEGAQVSRVVETRLWFSTDDGATWAKVRLRRLAPGRYQGVLPAAALHPGTYVSLRTVARDAGGSRIDQTLLRSFPVR